MADIQNNPSLWKSSFVTILVVNLLTGIAMYGLLLTEPWVLGRYFQENLSVAGAVVSVFGAGIFLFGPFANYWLDRYKRKSVVLWAQFFMLLFTVATLYRLPEWMYIAARFMQGAAYGLFQIALGATLLIDLTHTKKRTKAAYWYYWVTRFALALGPLAALVLNLYFDWENVICFHAVAVLVAHPAASCAVPHSAGAQMLFARPILAAPCQDPVLYAGSDQFPVGTAPAA